MKYGIVLILLVTTLLSATKINIAVLELSGNGVSADDVAGLSNRLRVELFKTGQYTIVERSLMKEILQEHEFQNTGCTDSDCAVQIGQILNVDKMVAGSVDKVGSVYSISIRLINVGTGEIEKVANRDCMNCTVGEVLVTSIGEAALELTGITAEAVQKNNPEVSVSSEKSSKTADSKHGPLHEFQLMGGIVADFPANSMFSISGEAGLRTRRRWIHTASFAFGDGGNNVGLFYNLSKDIHVNGIFSFAPGISLGYKELFWQEAKMNENGYWQNKEWFSTIGGAHLRLTVRGNYLGLMAKTGLDFGKVEEENHAQSDGGREEEGQGPEPYFSVNIHQSLMLLLAIPKRRK